MLIVTIIQEMATRHELLLLVAAAEPDGVERLMTEYARLHVPIAHIACAEEWLSEEKVEQLCAQREMRYIAEEDFADAAKDYADEYKNE